CSPNGGRAELAHPCARTCGACSAVRPRAAASCKNASLTSLPASWPALVWRVTTRLSWRITRRDALRYSALRAEAALPPAVIVPGFGRAGDNPPLRQRQAGCAVLLPPYALDLSPSFMKGIAAPAARGCCPRLNSAYAARGKLRFVASHPWPA